MRDCICLRSESCDILFFLLSNNNISMKNTLAIVVPCYNEEDMLPLTVSKLSDVISSLAKEGLVTDNSFMLLVNDGSKDQTWPLIKKYSNENRFVCGVNLSGNVGHQNALMAGLTVAKDNSDITISIDADLQDDVNVMKQMVLSYIEGYDIVYGVRDNRDSDTMFKRVTAQGFYKVMKTLGVKTVYNHADYRLMSKRAVEYLCEFKERNLFLRGLVPLLGFKSSSVYYKRYERVAGESKYPLRKMLHLAVDGITSFSVTPVRFVFVLGLIFILVALSILIYVAISYASHNVVPGWSSLMLSLWFCSGCVLLCLGIIGEYIGKIYIEIKGRPRYYIAETIINKR